MPFFKPREKRNAVNLTVRIKCDYGWGEAQIKNVSSRGMMLSCEAPPKLGSYVEIIRGSYVVVGRIVWSAADSFGLRSQDRIELTDLGISKRGAAFGGGDCQKASRAVHRMHRKELSIAERHEASTRFARLFQYGAMVLAVTGFAWLIADTAVSAIADPLSAVENALSSAH